MISKVILKLIKLQIFRYYDYNLNGSPKMRYAALGSEWFQVLILEKNHYSLMYSLVSYIFSIGLILVNSKDAVLNINNKIGP